MTSSRLIASLICLILAISAAAQDIVSVGRWTNGPCGSLDERGGVVAVGNGAALELLTVDAFGAATVRGRIALPDVAVDVELLAGYALASCGAAGLAVVDLADVDAPSLLSVWDAGHAVNGAAWTGGRYAFVAEDSVSLRVIDLQDPSAPESVYGPASFARRLCIEQVGDHVYLGDDGGDLYIYDVGDARHPVFTDWYGESGDVFDLEVAGGYAYMAQGPVGLVVVDVHNPYNVFDAGSLPYAGDFFLGVAVGEGVAYVAAAGGGLRVIDTADLGAMTEIGFLDTDGYAHDAVLSGDTVLMADSWPGVRIADVTSPATPLSLGTVLARPEARRVAVDGALLGVADAAGSLRLLDVADPANPNEVASLSLSRVEDVDLGEGLAVVARERDGMTIATLGTPAALATVDTDGLARAAVLGRGHAWLADGDGGLRVYDVADPSSPVEVGHLAVGDDLRDVALHGDHVVLADEGDGLIVVDATDPASPLPVGLLALAGVPRAVSVADGHAYVAAGGGGLRIVSLADPGDPVEVASLALGADVRDVRLAVGYAVVAAGFHGVRVVDVTDPTTPQEIASFDADDASGVAVRGRHIYLADGFDGVRVLRTELTVGNEDDPGDEPGDDRPPSAPALFAELHAPTPNPANPGVALRFSLREPVETRLDLYDLRGRLVRRLAAGPMPAGDHVRVWDGRDDRGAAAPSGAYVARLVAGDAVSGRSLSLVR